MRATVMLKAHCSAVLIIMWTRYKTSKTTTYK